LRGKRKAPTDVLEDTHQPFINGQKRPGTVLAGINVSSAEDEVLVDYPIHNHRIPESGINQHLDSAHFAWQLLEPSTIAITA
jgi:hypothetical protein